MGHFYNPPSAFLGGRQPLEPRKLLPQSGVTPDNPPIRGRHVQAAITAAWAPETVTVIYTSSVGAFISPASVDNPPITTTATLNSILAQWAPPDIRPPKAGRFAPLLGSPAAPDNPPRTSYTRLYSIIGQWAPPPPKPHQLRISAALLPSGIVATIRFRRTLSGLGSKAGKRQVDF